MFSIVCLLSSFLILRIFFLIILLVLFFVRLSSFGVVLRFVCVIVVIRRDRYCRNGWLKHCYRFGWLKHDFEVCG